MNKIIPLALLLAFLAGCAGMDDMSSDGTMMKEDKMESMDSMKDSGKKDHMMKEDKMM